MAQNIVSGVGNYVKAEALYLAGLSPDRQVITLQDEDYENLCEAVKGVLQASYKDCGASIRDYVTTDGEKGQASTKFKVYGKKFDPCGNGVVRTKTKDGRVTHWCPAVQN
jgi:formamidopyrimidine-DNA glycosylase